MALDLFAGIPVADHAVALTWYERLLGSEPTFVVSDTEAVWELAEHRSVSSILRRPRWPSPRPPREGSERTLTHEWAYVRPYHSEAEEVT